MLFEQRKCYKHFCEEYFLRFLNGTFWNTCTRLYLSTYFLVIPCLVCVVVSLRKRKLKNHSCKNNRNIHAAQTTAFYSLRNRQTLDFYLWVLMNLSLAYYCIVESRVEQNLDHYLNYLQKYKWLVVESIFLCNENNSSCW